MRDRLMSLPAWILFPGIAIPSAVVMLVIDLIAGGGGRPAAVSAGLFGALAGAAVVLGLRLAAGMENRAFGQVSVEVRRAARRAAWTGPVPGDPELRTAALGLAELSLQRLRRTRPFLA